MKRRLALLTLTLGLAACSPSLVTPTGPAPAPSPVDPLKATLRIDVKEGYQVVRFYAGDGDATATVRLFGSGIVVNTAGCEAAGVDVVCKLGTVASTWAFVIPARNVVRARAEYTRADAKMYTLDAISTATK